MNIEIERRWLVLLSELPGELLLSPTTKITQGYLSRPEDPYVLRVRTNEYTDREPLALQTLKQPAPVGMYEDEYPIPFDSAQHLLQVAHAKVSKTRLNLDLGFPEDYHCTLDIFNDISLPNGPLCILEIETPEGDSPLVVPPWAGPEITGVNALSNVALSFHRLWAIDTANNTWQCGKSKA